MPAEIVVLLRPDKFADMRMQILAHGRAVVDHRVDQVLKGEFWPLLVAGIEDSKPPQNRRRRFRP